MRKSIISLLVMLPLAAFANKGGGSEYFYQSETGKHDVTPRLSMNSLELEYSGGTKEETSTNTLSAEYEYGWMDGVAVGAVLGYTFSGDYDTGTNTGDISGLNNLEAFVKANMPAGPGTLRYGATLSLSTADREIESNGDLNASTGGHDLTPYVGYENTWDNCTLGAKLALQVGLTDRTTKAFGSSNDYSGEEHTMISLFYEHKFSDDVLLGTSLDWITTSDRKNETTGSAAVDVLSPTQALSVYLPSKLGAGTILPELEYVMSSDDSSNGTAVDGYTELNIKVGYRIEL